MPGIGRVSLVAAGGVTSGADIMEMISLGASGVQMATRFVLSKECDVHESFKSLFLNKEEKIPFIRKSIIKLDTLKIFLQIAWEIDALDKKKYIAISLPLSEIGKGRPGPA